MKHSDLQIQLITGSPEGDSTMFKQYAQFTGAMFSYNLSSVQVVRIKKIVIELFSEKDTLYLIPEKEGASLYTVRKSFDFNEFYQQRISKKKGNVNCNSQR